VSFFNCIAGLYCVVMYMGKSNLMLWVYYFRHDCGVIMLKAMEIWDGDKKYDGKSMPQYTTEELLGIRKKYVCDWILDNENITRMEALQLYGIV
ncbi:hypothetical protein VIGAN_06041900, partial [Vigna angularis var. angularis]